jgi:hypothetical protein
MTSPLYRHDSEEAKIIRALIRRGQPLTARELSRATHVPVAHVRAHLEHLADGQRSKPRQGRPTTYFTLKNQWRPVANRVTHKIDYEQVNPPSKTPLKVAPKPAFRIEDPEPERALPEPGRSRSATEPQPSLHHQISSFVQNQVAKSRCAVSRDAIFDHMRSLGYDVEDIELAFDDLRGADERAYRAGGLRESRPNAPFNPSSVPGYLVVTNAQAVRDGAKREYFAERWRRERAGSHG